MLCWLIALPMASKFFHVHHEFRAGKAQQWWETAQAAMAPGGGWDEAVAKNQAAGFYNHSFCPIGLEGPPPKKHKTQTTKNEKKTPKMTS